MQGSKTRRNNGQFGERGIQETRKIKADKSQRQTDTQTNKPTRYDGLNQSIEFDTSPDELLEEEDSRAKSSVSFNDFLKTSSVPILLTADCHAERNKFKRELTASEATR